MSKKENPDGLDASFIISQTSKRRREEPAPDIEESVEVLHEKETPPDPPKDESRRRRGKTQDYESLFMREVGISARSGKTVNIREEHHKRILRILQVVGENKVSLFSYIDNVLEHHFSTYQDEISTLYKKRNTDIF